MNNLNKTELFQIFGTIFFSIALAHTFLVGKINKLAKKYQLGSVGENLFHFFGEVEIVFGLWSAVFICFLVIFIDFNFVNEYLNSRNFTEAIFVFVIMSISATRPIISTIEKILIFLSRLIPIHKNLSIYFTLLFISPLLGSFITEPAAMTISAMLLLPRFFTDKQSFKFKYATLSLLFINISIGGTLTPFAAPPVLMVAGKWGWGLSYMLFNFAPKTVLSLLVNTLIAMFLFKKEIKKSSFEVEKTNNHISIPNWIVFIQFIFLLLAVLLSHYSVLIIGVFLFFLGYHKATKEFQAYLSLNEPLLVSFFLSGLIILGGAQQWWLEPLISSLTKFQLYFGAIGLTAFTDNAALTYLGSLVSSLDENSKLALVQGSVIGGGLTLIANAPNPAGFGILKESFDSEGFSPLILLKWSIPFMIIAALIFLM